MFRVILLILLAVVSASTFADIDTGQINQVFGLMRSIEAEKAAQQALKIYIIVALIVGLINLALCFVVAKFARNKGHSFLGFFLLSFFFSVIIGFIVALLMPANAPNIEQAQYQSGGRRKCPFCAELVASEAKICKHCQRELPAIAPSEDGPKIIDIQNIERATGIRLKINDLQDGEAQAAGILRGDIILSCGGIQIQSIEELSSALIKFAGKQVQLIILRGTEIHGFLFTVRPLEAASTSFLGIVKSGLLAVELEDSSNQQAVSLLKAQHHSQNGLHLPFVSSVTKYVAIGALAISILGGVAYWGWVQMIAIPLQMVSIPGKNYEIGKYEVTQVQWEEVMGSNPSKYSSCDRRTSCPAVQVSWNDVQEFIQKLNSKTGKQYRLPTEVEWEYACYGGSQSEYCGGNDRDAVSWNEENGHYQTHPVGQKRANGYGLYDMSGNVWEWTDGCWGEDCTMRVVRGGSWDDKLQYVRASGRNRIEAAGREDAGGFRLARTLP